MQCLTLVGLLHAKSRIITDNGVTQVTTDLDDLISSNISTFQSNRHSLSIKCEFLLILLQIRYKHCISYSVDRGKKVLFNVY